MTPSEIAENERLKAVNVKRAATIADLVLERDEAVELLREFMNEGDTSSVYNDVRDFLARIDVTNNTVA